MNAHPNHIRAFTLIELLVVIAVIMDLGLSGKGAHDGSKRWK